MLKLREIFLMNRFSQRIQDIFNIESPILTQIIISLIVILVIWIIKVIILRIALRKQEDVKKHYYWRKTTNYITFFLVIIILGYIWFTEVQPVATFLGLLSAGLAIALRDPVVNFAGWGFIIWRRPFEVGDRIQIGAYAGDVIDLRIFQFTLVEIGNWVDADQSTGRIIHVPNAKIFNEVLANYTTGFNYIWNEIPVLVTFESDWRKAKEILTNIIRENAENISGEAEKKIKQAAQKFMIFFRKLTPIVYTSVKDHGVMLTIRYMCDPRKRRSSEEVIWEAILDEFAKNDDIDFAYPTRRIFNNLLEGKEGTKPPDFKEE